MPPPSTNKVAHSGFETQRRRHQKSKTRVSMAPEKGLIHVLQTFLKICEDGTVVPVYMSELHCNRINFVYNFW